MSSNKQAQRATRQAMKRRDFLQRAGWGSVGVTGIIIGASRSRALAHPPSPYPEWIPPSDKPPKRGGILTLASTTDPMEQAPWLAIFPGLAISLTVLGFNLFGDTLRDVWDPKLRGRS